MDELFVRARRVERNTTPRAHRRIANLRKLVPPRPARVPRCHVDPGDFRMFGAWWPMRHFYGPAWHNA